jgi:DNA replication licensing factor MCM2
MWIDDLSLVQAKEHEIYDTAPFMQCRLFAANGYTLNGDVIEKRFKQQN